MTEKQSNQEQYPQNYPPYEDEINLIDYLKVLWKWKWLIIAGTMICAVAAAVISLQMPKIYEISTVIALFMAVFLAFFIEYIKNASKASSANKRT